MRFRWLLWVMTVFFLWVVIRRFNELENLTQTLVEGQWQWIAAALGLQFVHFLLYAFLYKSAFSTVDVDAPVMDMLALTYASIFVNSTAPSGGTAGAAMFIDDMRRRGQSVTRAATGGLLALIADYGGFCVLLLFGLLALFRFHSLTNYEVIAALIMFAFVGALFVALIIGLWRPLLLYQMFGLLERWANQVGGWFRHPDLLPPEWGERYADEFIEGAQVMMQRQLGVLRTLLLALFAHSLNVIILLCIFRAFGQEPTLGVLIAGYTMTILFLIVSPTPNGIGIVETLMPVIYVSMGLPAADAAVISFAFRGLTFWLPLLIGFFLLRRLHMFSRSEQSVAETGQVRIAAVLTALMGLVNVVSGTTPALGERLDWLAYFAPLSISHGGHVTSVIAGFALILLALRLWHRKRSAFWLTIGVLILSVFIHLVKGLDVEEATVALVFAIFLFTQRSHFYAVSDPPSVLHGLRILAVSVFFTLGYGAIGFYLLTRHFQAAYDLDTALRQTVLLFWPWATSAPLPATDFGAFFISSIYLVGLSTVSYGLFETLQSLLVYTPANVAEQRRATAIVERHGRTSLARLALLPDKLFHFTPGGSVLAYTVHRRTALVLGDPIGPSEDTLNAILDFKRFAEKSDWQIAFFQTQPACQELYKKCNFQILRIGHEGLVDLQKLSSSLHLDRNNRNLVQTLEQRGYRAQLHRPPLNDLLMDELQVISDQWLTLIHSTERRFAFGWFDEGYIRSAVIFALHAPDQSIVAFASLLPEYQRNEMGIDLMRRRTDVEAGAMDLLFISLLRWAKENGYDTFNLGMRTSPDDTFQSDSALTASAVTELSAHLDYFYRFRGLHDFSEKLDCDWQPRYLAFADAAHFPRILSTLNHAIMGDEPVVDLVRGAVDRVRGRKPTPALPQLPEKSSAHTNHDVDSEAAKSHTRD